MTGNNMKVVLAEFSILSQVVLFRVWLHPIHNYVLA